MNWIRLVLQELLLLLLMISSMPSVAGTPVWTFTPDPYYPPNILISDTNTETVQYVITNQSRVTHTLMMQPIPGVTQRTNVGNCGNPFTLGYLQSCTLSLSVTGSALIHDVHGGPVVCQQGSSLLCYQPSAANSLNITRIPISQYLISTVAGAHGSIAPAGQLGVEEGGSVAFTATPDAGYHVDKWIVDDGIAQVGGSSFTLPDIIANHTVEVTFTQAGVIFAGSASGLLHYSNDNGRTWTATTTPAPGASLNGIFVNSTILYVGSADGHVYFSTDNGNTWTPTASVPGGTAITSLFVATISSVPTIYVGTQNGNVYHTVDGTTWTPDTPPGSGAVNSIFITAQNTIYVGSADGNVYYSTNLGTSWNLINGPSVMSGSPIQNVFATSTQLFINSRHVSSDPTLPPGTVDFEYTFTSGSLTNPNPVWSIFSQITYTLFVNADASVIQAGTQNGYVYSLTTGDELGFVSPDPITSLFFLA